VNRFELSGHRTAPGPRASAPAAAMTEEVCRNLPTLPPAPARCGRGRPRPGPQASSPAATITEEACRNLPALPPTPARCGRGRPRPMSLGFQLHHPGGMFENSPAFQRRDDAKRAPSPAGTAEIECFGRPSGTYPSGTSIPALKRRAIIASPSGTETGPVTSNPSGIGRPRPQQHRTSTAAFRSPRKAPPSSPRGKSSPGAPILLFAYCSLLIPPP
jgi:hypothetical protein